MTMGAPMEQTTRISPEELVAHPRALEPLLAEGCMSTAWMYGVDVRFRSLKNFQKLRISQDSSGNWPR
jgi:hypothetical protein